MNPLPAANIKKAENGLKVAIASACVLAALKIVTALATHSMSILASALDSVMDAGMSTVNLIAVRQASQPPDEEHTYGHGKIESLAGLFQSTFIGLGGLYLIFEAFKRWFVGSYVSDAPVGMVVMTFSMSLSWLVVWWLERVGRDLRSLIVSAEKLHYAMDIYANLGVITALGLVKITGQYFWDLLVSIAVSLYIFNSAYRILRQSIDELLDRSLPAATKENIEQLIFSYHPAIIGIHEFRSHRVGQKIFLDFHIEIRGEEDFRKAHSLTEGLIRRLQHHYPTADVTVHYDPEGAD